MTSDRDTTLADKQHRVTEIVKSGVILMPPKVTETNDNMFL